MAYLDPKSSANNYEAYQMENMYEQPQNSELDTPTHLPNPYETAEHSNSSVEDNTLHSMGANESIYEDPGHVKENIYEWFEQKKMKKLDKTNIRCSGSL